jgi:putative sugar O-methyltransferase
MQYKLTKNFIERYEAFSRSDVYKDVNEYSKSDYWKYHSSRVKVKVSENNLTATGESGFYTSSSNNLKEIIRKVFSVMRSPSKLTEWLRIKIGLSSDGIKLLSYFDAFEKVMGRHPVTDPDLSPFRINFDNLRNRNNLISSVSKCKENYFDIVRGRISFSGHVLLSYYHLNILYSYVALNNWKEKKVVLEIGAGNGNLMSIIKSNAGSNTTIIDVDLPETISHSVLYIVSVFPSAKILMPNEVESIKQKKIDFHEYDFVFLTPYQVYLIDDDFVDLSINMNSFQEMTHKQINEYFNLIQRVGKNNSYFFTSNRAEKLPCGEGSYEKETTVLPNRFSDYPWNNSNETIIFEICRMVRLVQLDPVFIRLEKIKNIL